MEKWAALLRRRLEIWALRGLCRCSDITAFTVATQNYMGMQWMHSLFWNCRLRGINYWYCSYLCCWHCTRTTRRTTISQSHDTGVIVIVCMNAQHCNHKCMFVHFVHVLFCLLFLRFRFLVLVTSGLRLIVVGFVNGPKRTPRFLQFGKVKLYRHEYI